MALTDGMSTSPARDFKSVAKVYTRTAGQTFAVQDNGVADADFNLTVPAGKTATINVQVSVVIQ